MILSTHDHVPSGGTADRIAEMLLGMTAMGFVVVSGAPATGKSHTLRSLAATLEASGRSVLSGSGTHDAEPYGLLVDALGIAPTSDGSRVLAAFEDRCIESPPAVVVLDDIEDADPHSIGLLARVLHRHENPTHLVLAASGPATRGDAMRRLLALFDVEREVRYIETAPLSLEEIGRVVEHRCGTAVERHVIADVQAATGGHPYLVVQVAAALAARDANDGADLRLPSSRAARVLDRMLGTDAAARAVAEAAALLDIFGPKGIPLLSAMTKRADEEVADGLDRLAVGGVLDGQGVDLRFRYPLVRRALLDGLLPGARRQAHARAVAWLERQPHSDDRPVELARHVAAVAQDGDEKAVATLTEAAMIEQRHRRPRAAARWYEAAISLLPADHPARPALLGRLSSALLAGGRSADAITAGQEALAHLPNGGQHAVNVRVVADAIALESIERPTLDRLAFLEAQCAHEPRDRRTLAICAHVMARAGRLRGASRAIAHVPDTDAGGIDDRAVALVHLARANGLLGRYAEMHRDLRDAALLLEEASPPAQLLGRSLIAYMLAEHGSPAATGAIEAATALIRRTAWTMGESGVEVALVLDAHRRGDWGRALDLAQELGPRLARAESYSRLAVVRAIELDILAGRGRWADARHLQWGPINGQTSDGLREWALAGVELRSGSETAARDRLVRALDRIGLPWARHLLLARLAEAHLLAGDLASAEQAGLDVVNAASIEDVGLWVLDAWRVVGIATQDAEALRTLAVVAGERGAPMLEATATLAIGELGPGSERHLRAAHEGFVGLGAEPWRRRAAATLRARGMRRPNLRPCSSDELTELELRIAQLVQEGRRNREIANSLSISVKTVEAYLTRVYAKTNCSSRLELARHLDAASGRVPVAGV